MSLKEKASQGCYHCSCCSHYHGIAKGCDLPECAFVPRKLLEDVQKEIKKVKELGAEVATVMIEGELKDLKQKLQQLLNEFPSKTGGAPGANWRFNLYSTREIDEWKKKFEELLKL
jgi:hypothetical protein